MQGESKCECRNLIEIVKEFLEKIEKSLNLNEYDVEDVKAELDEISKSVAQILSKWCPQIIYVLLMNEMTFNGLRKCLNVSSRVLSDKLKLLEEIGIVKRKVEDSKPPRVQYSLTKKGKIIALSLVPLLITVKLSKPPQ